VLTFEQLIIATGSFARPVAFPGWTLPGVGSPIGTRVGVAGYGAALAVAVSALQSRGFTPLAVLDPEAPDGRLPIRAEGTEHLERLVTVRVDADWRPKPGTQTTLDLDTLVLAFGWLPEDRLARLAGCQMCGSPFVDPSTVRDAWLRTSVEGVLVAGDAGGIVDAESATDQGRLAGLTAALDAGCIEADEAYRRAEPIQRRLQDAAQPERPREGLFDLATRDTVVCGCEDVTAAEIAARIFPGNLEPAGVIAETRATMGLCQGRKCASLVAATIARQSGVPLDRVPPITPRPPVVPVPLGALAERPPVFPPISGLGAAR
jgi:NAD(P)H-nitrite reductase large subunit